MRIKSYRSAAGLLFLGLLLALVLPAGAQTPPLSGWLPFDGGGSPSAPALAVLGSDESVVDLQADLPGAQVDEIKAEGQVYSRLAGEGYGVAAPIGMPNVPVLRRDVEIPFGAEVSLEVVDASYSDHALVDLGLHAIYPVQAPVPKEPGAVEAAPFAIDRQFYASGTLFPAAPVALGEPYVVRGHRVVPVEVWPVGYDPSAGTVRLYSAVTFRLRLAGSDMARTAELAQRYASPAFETSLAQRILNYNQGRPPVTFAPDTPVGYLIVTADAYHDAMLPFASLKESRGFDVTMTRISEIPGGGSNAAIKAYIEEAYDTWPIAPSYVLLVGDTDTVPGWNSVSAGQVTDLYYATMDGANDWHPDIGRGRFPVRSPAQTTIMVDKYLEYADLAGVEPWLKWAAFIATCDQYQVAEGTHNYVINNYTLPNGYSGIFPNDPQPGGDRLYCITHNANASDIQASLNQGRWVAIYSGHGSRTGWEMSYGMSQVQALVNSGMFPFVASHACNTGDFATYETFGETWVLQEDAGALVFWGSSDSSYWSEDDWLERGMFDELFAEVKGYANVTEMTYYGLAHVEDMSPGMARYYWETYNVMGDPAVKIFLEPDLPTFTLSVDPAQHQVCSSGDVQSTVSIGSILGYNQTVYLDTEPTPPGISASFDPPSAPAPFTSDLTLEVAPGTEAGDYGLTVVATDYVSYTLDTGVDLRVVTDAPAAPALVSPADGAMDEPFAPTFEWEAAEWAHSYRFRLGRTPLFEVPLIDEPGLPGPTFTPGSPLEGGLCYWWQAVGENACGEGAWADPFHFATVALDVAFFDNMELGDSQWSHAAAQGTDNWTISDAQSHSPTHAWFVPDDSVVTDSRLRTVTPVLLGAGSGLSFWHRYQFEGTSYDGSVLEMSTNGGSTWTDLGSYITANGYNGTISTCCSNPLGGRQGWTGDLTTWTQVEVNLSSFAGQSALFRWRIGCDSSISDVGWYIDDVQITSPLPPNPAPTLAGITPNYGPPDAPTPVEVTGSNLLDIPSLRLGDTWLEDVTLVDGSHLTAVVPAGMEEGTYDLVLYNGDCQEATLANAYTVGSGAPVPIHVQAIALRSWPGGNWRLVLGLVRIVSETGAPVPGAVVDAEWTLPAGGTRAQEATTSAIGLTSFRILSRQTGTYQVCVTDVTRAGYLYDPDQNLETCDTLVVP